MTNSIRKFLNPMNVLSVALAAGTVVTMAPASLATDFAALATVSVIQAPTTVTPVTVSSITFGDAIQEKAREYGYRELATLSAYMERAVGREIVSMGFTTAVEQQLVLDIVIEDADPNRPTSRQQMSGGLHASSFSIGGASISATLSDHQGNVVDEFSYEWSSNNIRNAQYASTWTDARRTINQFADEIAERVAIAIES